MRCSIEFRRALNNITQHGRPAVKERKENSSEISSWSKRKDHADKTLYEIGIIDIDEAQNKVKIHYKGYGSEFDEWPCVELGIPICLEELRLPGDDSLEDSYNSFYDILYREVKKKLYSTMRDVPAFE